MICEIDIFLMPNALIPMGMPSLMKDFSYKISTETFEAAAPSNSNWQGLL